MIADQMTKPLVGTTFIHQGEHPGPAAGVYWRNYLETYIPVLKLPDIYTQVN